MHAEPVAVDSAGREPAQNAVVPHAEATEDLRADGARGLRRRELEPSECIRWDCDLPRDHPEDVLAKAGRAGHVFGRNRVGCHGGSL